MTEEWLPIAGYEGIYEVSNHGRVRSLDRRDSRGNRLNGQIKRLGITPSGHLNVSLCRDGKQTTFNVHRLVLETFVGPCPDGMECLHGNGIPSDNLLPNLRWGTSAENSADSIAHGTSNRGEQNGRCKLTEDDVRRIRFECMMDTQSAVAATFGVSRTTIERIVNRRTWKHVA